MAQLGQWVPAEELASGIGALLAEEGLSAEAKVEQIKAYAEQRGIPITADGGEYASTSIRLRPALQKCHCLTPLLRDAGDDSAFIDALMSWGDFDAVASWRGVDGILTQLKTLGTYGASPVPFMCKLTL